MSIPYEALYIGQALFDAGTASFSHWRKQQDIIADTNSRYKQASMNNDLAVISQLHINQEDALDLKAFGFETTDLRFAMRREEAKQAAIEASMGGMFGRSGQSVQATQLNIERHGYKALARKDLNRQIRELSFSQRKENAANQALSKNNALMSGVQTLPSGTGLALQIGSSGVQAAIGMKKGTERGYARAQEIS
tara:strand:- start:61 stop:642 length:582 start_codon:yes stop_codon:yes gene_type:complete